MPSRSLPPAVTAFSLIILLWVVCTLHTIWMHFCAARAKIPNKKSKIKFTLRNIAISYLISYSIAYIAALCLTTLALSDVYFFYDDEVGYKMMIIIIMIAGTIGFMSFYSFTVTRLYYTFHDTAFKIRRRIVVIYLILSSIISILFCFYGSTYFLFRKQFLSSIGNKNVLMGTAGIAAIINMIICASLIYLFANKLTQIALLQRRTIMDRYTVDLSLTGRQRGLIDIVTKQVLLNIMGIISFNILIPLAIIIYTFLPSHNVYSYLTTILFGFIFHSIEMLCVILSFGYNKKYYDCCCKLCHNGCNKCCESVAEREVIKRLDSEEDTDYHPL